jgi:bifunctional DNA-binding transcriptional regulator/antitoxin component of YhaV-PrlF toxin-antitoxin module
LPLRFKRKAFLTGGSLRINIPSEIVDTLEIKPRDVLSIWLNDGQIVMEKIAGEKKRQTG